jgi:hypothetical protein
LKSGATWSFKIVGKRLTYKELTGKVEETASPKTRQGRGKRKRVIIEGV